MSYGDSNGDGGSRDRCPLAAARGLLAAVEALQGSELNGLSERELVAVLDTVETQARRLPAVRDALVAQVQRRDVAPSHGSRSTSAWLQNRFHIGRGEARTWLRGAERLTPRLSLTGEPLEPVLPTLAAARAAGKLSTEQVKVIDDLDEQLPTRLDPADRRDIEQVMVDHAQQYNPTMLSRLGQHLLDRVDPDGTEPNSEDAHRRRGLTIGPLRHGLARISGYVDAWTREVLLTALASLSDPDPAATTDTSRRTQTADGHTSEANTDSEPTDADTADPNSEPTHADTADPNSKPTHADTADPNSKPTHADTAETSSGPRSASAADTDSGSGVAETSGSQGDSRTAETESASDDPGTAAPESRGGQPLQRPLDADRRTHPQRLVDALTQLCERQLSNGRLPRRGGTPATVLVTIPLATLEARTGFASTAHGGDITTREVIRRAGDLTFVPIVIDDVGNPLYLGRTRRLASPLQRLALHVRDGGCIIPGCATASQDCETHHLHNWADGGRTDIDNLALVCSYHHHRIDDWTLELKNGRIWCTPPFGMNLDPDPQLNTYFRGAPHPHLFE